MKADKFLVYVKENRIERISDLNAFDDDKIDSVSIMSFDTLTEKDLQKLLDFIKYKEEEIKEISKEKDYWLEAYKEKERQNCELSSLLYNFVEAAQRKLKEN